MHTLIFDLDGTLVDSAPGIVASLVHAVRALGHDFTPFAGTELLLGPPMTHVLSQLLAPYRDDRVAQGVELYREHYAQHGIAFTSPYPGIHTAIAELATRGHVLHVATSKRQIFAERILSDTGLRGYFRSIHGTSSDGRLDDKAVLLRELLEAWDITPVSACMIGDKRNDVIAAHANGLPALGILWGYGTRAELLGSGADALLEQPGQLIDAFHCA